MTRVVLDLETDSLTPKVLHCIVTQDLDTGEVKTYATKGGDSGASTFDKFLTDAKSYTLIIGHNALSFDLPALHSLLGFEYHGTVHDTLILSRLLKQDIENGHSLEAWGPRLKHPKLEFQDFHTYSEAMLTYCKNDVSLNVKLYTFLTKKLKPDVFGKAIEVEHEVQKILNDTKRAGFPFDMEKMNVLRKEIEERVSELDALIVAGFPPRFYSLGEYVPRLTKHGTISRHNLRWYEGSDFSVFMDGCSFCRLGVEHFNPGSVKQIVTRLTDNDWWEPTDRTNGYIEAVRTRDRDKASRLEKYGWKVSETNLSTLRSTELEEAWVNKCQVLIPNTTKNTINEIKKRKDGQPLSTIMLTLDDLNPKLSKEITELISTSLSKWLQNKMDAAQFVEKEKNLWSITVTPEDTLEVYYVGCVTGTSDGSNVTQIARKRISEIAAARLLVERLALGNRLSTFDQWSSAYNTDTASIHGTINGIGTWTHRCSHTNPNLANIAAKKSIKYKEPSLAKKITELGGRMRDLFHCGGTDGKHWLVGTDAEGIQLRLFAHYANDDALIKANVEGNKDLGTDIHTLNQRALGDCCRTRDDAKTWIYAYLLGAGLPKLSNILGCSTRDGKQALERLLSTYQSIKELRENIIPRDAAQGYFKGLDGRLVCCSSKHLMLAGYLQNGEVLVMKHAMVKWHKELKNDFRLANFVHDEWQTIVYGTREEAEHVALVQRQSIEWAGRELGVRCPLAGSSSIGKTWLDTH